MKHSRTKSMARVAFVTNLVPSYRYPIFELLTRAKTFCFQILVTRRLTASCREAVASLPIKYTASLNLTRTTRHKRSGTIQIEQLPIPLGLVKDLLIDRPNIIVAGDWGVRSLLCWVISRLTGARLVIWSEEISTSAMGRSRLQRMLHRFLSKRAHAFLAWGNPARLYLKTLNVCEDHIFVCAQAVANEFWFRQADNLNRNEERASFGFNKFVFLLVGRTVELKGFQNFLEAFSRLPTESRSKTSAV